MRLLTLFRLPFAAAVLVVLGAAVAGDPWLIALGLAAAAFVYTLGRDPVRSVPSHPLGIVSPVDGRVTRIDETRDPFLDRDVLAMRIEQGLFMPAILCSPTEGRVEQIWSGPAVAALEPGGRLAVQLRTDEGDEVVFVVGRAAGIPGPLRWSVQPGERVGQGQRRGLAGWGRPVTVYLPGGSTPAVQSGAAVQAGADLVCRLVHAG